MKFKILTLSDPEQIAITKAIDAFADSAAWNRNPETIATVKTLIPVFRQLLGASEFESRDPDTAQSIVRLLSRRHENEETGRALGELVAIAAPGELVTIHNRPGCPMGRFVASLNGRGWADASLQEALQNCLVRIKQEDGG